MEPEILQVLTRIADALERLARSEGPEEPNYIRPMAEFSAFDWASIGATVVQSDQFGPTHLEWNGALWTRRSPQNKFGMAIWFSRANGKDDDGNVKYLRLVTFKEISDADPLPGKLAASMAAPAAQPAPASAPAKPAPAKAPAQPAPAPAATATFNGDKARPYLPAVVRAGLVAQAPKLAQFIPTREQRGLLRFALELCFPGEEGVSDKRHTVLKYLTGKPSVNDIDGRTLKFLLERWLKALPEEGGGYTVDPMAAQEAHAIYAAALEAEGQEKLL